MLIESIVLAIFVCSSGGALLILIRKIPVLNSLPQNGGSGYTKNQLILNIENRVKNIFTFFEKQIFMHKLLSWVKVMTLKIETKIDHSLHKIRKKAQQVDKNSEKK